MDTSAESLSALLGQECEARDQKTDLLHKVYVAHSVKGQKSFTATIRLKNSPDDSRLTTHHKLHHNSSVNGQSYIDDSNAPVFIHDAISASNDRKTDRLVNARVVTNYLGESLAYTGRPDTFDKAKSQATMIFLNELKRLTPTDGTYELTYMVNSLLTPSWTTRFSQFNEKKSTLDQRAALKKLGEDIVELKEPETGRIYKVKFKPIFFSRPFNIYTRLEKFLPDSLTGRNLAKEISKEGYEELEPFIEQNTEAQEYYNVLIARGSELDAEKELMLRILIAKALTMPVVHHCKSSTDRTAIAIALAATMDQFQLLYPAEKLFDEDFNVSKKFKELFMANALAGHQITSMTRSAVGPVDGVELHDNNFGFSWGKKWMTNPSIGRLSPDRYLEDTTVRRDLIKPLFSKVGNMKVKHLVIIAFFALLLLPFTLIALGFAAYNASTFLVDKKWKDDHDLQTKHRIIGSSGSNLKLAKKAMKSKK